jgi:hypothetical protein
MHIPRPFLAAILAIAPAFAAPAGDLGPPPGPIAPTHKTLTQLEPRQILNDLPGDAQYTVRITEPGSYYLTADIIGSQGRIGLGIEADHVVIDLNGFALRGPGNLSEVGFVPIGQRSNITIRNGTIRNWGYASLAVAGHMRNCLFEDLTAIDNTAGSFEQSDIDNSIFRNIRVKGTGEVGITAGSNCVINNCTVEGTGVGITALFNTTISDCVTIECGTGIALFGNGIVERCSTRTSSASNSTVGIALGTGGIARNCSTVGAYIGIESNAFARIENCSVSFAVSEGIRYVQKDHITGNKITNCPSAIRSINNIGARSTIDSNIITSCPVGIRAVSTNNIITRNIVNESATPFDIVPGNKVGTIQTTPVGAGPWDNIAF